MGRSRCKNAGMKEILAQLKHMKKENPLIFRELRSSFNIAMMKLDRRVTNIERVESLLALKCGKLGKFALALEKDVFAGEESELLLNVEGRRSSGDKINFVRSVIFKYFVVSVHSEQSVWQTANNALTERQER
ncbi:unnamed protein product [Strongylus vulgaris]|uniref:Uncharacterized protein n=1 Tax=Strongylus vulgaris TaxID=40348 RepID=A0A3P7IP92_STRVU|nr:unnamed protein product [Strongylus vulgaris]